MRKIIFLISIIALNISTLIAQNVGINETGAAPNSNAMLDVNANTNHDKGILIPRLTTAQRTGISGLAAADEGLTVYDTDTHSYWYWDGSSWVWMGQKRYWALTGNAGTTVGTNFLGTTDNVSLSFKTNNTERMRILNSGNIGIGTTSPSERLEIYGSTQNIEISNTSETDAGITLNDAQATGSQYAKITYGSGDNDLNFLNASSTPRMVIENSGEVGIGTTSPSYQLDVTSATAARTGSFTNTETSADNYGVYGECAATDYYGYGGYFTGGYIGVRGKVTPTGSNTYFGVYSDAIGGSGNNFGIYAYANSSGGDYGAYGTVNGTGDHGIYGYNSTTSTTSDHTTSGVYGTSTYDVNGITSNTVYNAAIMGWDDPPNNHDGIGVFGHCWPSNNWGYGGWFNAGYYGVRAEGYAGDYYKSSNTNYNYYSGGVLAQGMVGVNAIGSKIGITAVSNEIGLLCIGNKDNNDPAAFFDGNVIRNGYDAMLIHNDNDNTNITAYTMVSNTVNIQAVGQGSLQNGHAIINFDNNFSSVVSSSDPIVVIVTPTATNMGNIIVTNTSANGFEVNSNISSNGTFNWIAIGKINGYDTQQTAIKNEYLDNDYINNKAEKLYPTSKEFSQFKSSDFFKTSKLNHTDNPISYNEKKQQIKKQLPNINNKVIKNH